MENVPFRCQVNADLFRRVAIAISTDETLYYLNGVHVEAHPNGGVQMVATDGHMLINMRDPNGFVEGSAIVQLYPAMLKSCGKAVWMMTGGGRGYPLLTVAGKRAGLLHMPASSLEEKRETEIAERFDQLNSLGIALGQLQWREVLIDGTFPDWRRLIAPVYPISHTEFNPKMLAKIGKAFAVESANTALSLRRTGSGKTNMDRPLLIQSSNKAIDGFALLMEMTPESTVPAWWPGSSPPAPIEPRTADMVAVVTAQGGLS
jgi:hypothetical protein